jgi:hypothetical protein
MRRALFGASIVLAAVVAVALWRRAEAPVVGGDDVRFPHVVDAILARVDSDGDGAISADEYARASLPDEPMDTYDVDGDGRISRTELEEGFLRVSPTAVQRQRIDRSGGGTPLSQ